jgi:hypothetical protein
VPLSATAKSYDEFGDGARLIKMNIMKSRPVTVQGQNQCFPDLQHLSPNVAGRENIENSYNNTKKQDQFRTKQIPFKI